MDEYNMPPSASQRPYQQSAVPPPLSAPRPRRGINGWRITAVVLAILLVFSLLSHVGWMLTSIVSGVATTGYTSAPQLEEVVVESHNSNNKIALISIEGVIFGGSMGRGGYNLVRFIEDQLRMAARDSQVKAVLLRINSPGGEVLASDEISRAIADFQKQTGKPVLASMGSVAASGGYYVASPCRWIVAHELTITGSIGVIMHNWNYRGLMNKVGIEPQVFKSGRFKDMLSGERDLINLSPTEKANLEEEERMIQRLVDQTYARFKQVVEEGRNNAVKLNQNNSGSPGRSLAEDWEEYIDGRIWSGAEAYEHGFVDELGNWRAAVDSAMKLSGITNADLVQYQQPIGLGNLFRILGKAEPTRIQLDMGVDLPRLEPGLLYFLSSTYVR